MTELAEAPAVEPGGAITRIPHWIGGKRVDGTSGRSGPVYNPALGVQSGAVDLASVEEIDAAVQNAAEAWESWRTMSLAKRAELFFRIRELFHAHREDLAKLLTAEHGKVLSDAMGEVARGLEVIEFACGIPTLIKGEFSEQASTGIDVYSIRQPLGVVAGITPFNFPAMVPMWMWAPAIACGNTFVLKPSEKDPSASVYTAERDPSASNFIAELYAEAGLPDGVFNVVHGDKVAVDAILEHPDIDAVSFVGSTPIARYVYETGTKKGKRMQSLGGAKNHMIVLPDADIDMAADAAVSAAYGSAGERCMAVSVVVAVGDVADPLIAAVKERLPKVKVGPGLEPDSEMGPLITREHRDKVAGYLDTAAEQGATVVADGRDLEVDGDGFFLGVSLIDEVTPEMDAYRDEIFGPVLSVVRAGTYDDAVKLVNENPYGNGTAIFTRDGGVARQFQFDVQAGMVGINVPIPVPVAYYSFGGWKASLFGDRHIYGPEGIDFYTRSKVVTSRWPDPATSKVDLGFPQTR
jgi:malonate-semialdehyde dehydrogenase (acetylating)/methylmalonate-semialdehyde dehydrogenase